MSARRAFVAAAAVAVFLAPTAEPPTSRSGAISPATRPRTSASGRAHSSRPPGGAPVAVSPVDRHGRPLAAEGRQYPGAR